jgi:RNA recognition motif-containing protein
MSKPGHHWDQDKEATVYVGNLDERVTDALVWELMLQAGRIVNVYLPKDRVTQVHQGFGFVEFKSEDDAEYAARIMNQVRLYGKPIRVNKVRSLSVDMGGIVLEIGIVLTRECRLRRTSRRQRRLVRSFMSEIWILWLTRKHSTIHSAHLATLFRYRR